MAPRLLGANDGVTDVKPKETACCATNTDADNWSTYAHIQAAGMQVAVSTDYVRQIVPKPPNLTQLPNRQGALTGVFKLRGQVVPVVNLHALTQLTSTSDTPHVMVLGKEGQVIGLAIEAMHGLLRLRTSRVQAVLRDDDEEGVFHSVLSVTDDSELLSVLDPVRLMKKARAWSDGATSTLFSTTAENSRTLRTGNGAGLTAIQALVRLGSTALGVPFHHVREVLVLPTVQRVFGRETVMLGMVRWREVDIPLADPTKVLLMPLTPSVQGQRLMMVLEHQGRHLALPVDGVMAVRTFAVDTVQSAKDTSLAPPGTYVGSCSLEDGQRVLLLDSKQVLEAYGFKPITQQTEARQVSGVLALEAETAITRATAQPHVVFDMGGEWAVPIHALHEITTFPVDFKPGKGQCDSVIGTFEWRKRSLPILDFRPSVDVPPTQAGSAEPPKLLVVETNQRIGAIVVNDVLALLPAHHGVHTLLNLPGGERMHLITIGEPPTRKSYRVLDVGALPFFIHGPR